MPHISQVADTYVQQAAALDPVWATFKGLAGHDHELTDYSPEAHEQAVDLQRQTLVALDEEAAADAQGRVIADLMRERFAAEQDLLAIEHLRRLSILGSPLQAIRVVFELMPRETVEHWARIATRLSGVPASLASFRRSLERGVGTGVVAARRQALACAKQAMIYGTGDDGGRPMGRGLLQAYEATGLDVESVRVSLRRAAQAADAAFGEFGRYLSQEYAPKAAEDDAVGEERYARYARYFTGADLDLEDVYAWGWDEVHRLDAAIAGTADRIKPGATPQEVVELLEHDPERAVHGVDAFRAWVQERQDAAVEALAGAHFDIPEPIKRIQVMVAPPGSAAAPHYTGPSEDFRRPGRIWYPTLGRELFPTWSEVSTAYHEGVPGHHLQIATVQYRSDVLSRFQRVTSVSGYSEGWALYGERLMSELGFHERPEYELGYLTGQILRALRIVIDIGLHTSRRIPPHEQMYPGARWTAEIAEEFLNRRSYQHPEFLASEVVRYLGIPAQAISYKLGERVWLRARQEANRRDGQAFSLPSFHGTALALGPMGLDQLASELARM